MAENADNIKDYSYDDIKPGLTESFHHTITKEEVETFGKLTGDHNPLHFDEEYASGTRFKECIVHGLLTTSFISRLIGMLLPGKNALYLAQEVEFVRPVKIGDTLNVVGTVINKFDESKKKFAIQTNIFNQEENLVVSGSAQILIRDEDFENAG